MSYCPFLGFKIRFIVLDPQELFSWFVSSGFRYKLNTALLGDSSEHYLVCRVLALIMVLVFISS